MPTAADAILTTMRAPDAFTAWAYPALAKATGLDVATVRRAVSRLRAAGVVRVGHWGREAVVALSDSDSRDTVRDPLERAARRLDRIRRDGLAHPKAGARVDAVAALVGQALAALRESGQRPGVLEERAQQAGEGGRRQGA